VAEAVFQVIFECAVFLVDIEVIAFVGIVGDEDIGPAVAVDVADGYAEAEADEAAVDAGLLCYFGEVAVIVPVEVVAAAFQEIGYGPFCIGEVASVGVVEGIDGDGAVVDHEAVEVAVAVIVEEGDLGSVGGDIEAVFGGCFGKGIVVVVDIEFILAIAVLHVAICRLL